MQGSVKRAVTLQISLAPNDLRHGALTLPHQLRQFGRQVDEIDLTLDLHRSGGRYGAGWEGQAPGMERLVEEIVGEWPQARVCRVDYSREAREQAGEAFLGGGEMPIK